MLMQALNELAIDYQITGTSPLLIKDGRYEKPNGAGNDLPNAVFISRFPGNGQKLFAAIQRISWREARFPFYIPGSSIRGSWRSHLEKVLRSLDAEPKVCEPFIAPSKDSGSKAAHRQYGACSERLQREVEEAVADPYRQSCPVCQLFGNTAQASRAAFSDGERVSGQPVLLDNVAISRHTGAVISPFKSLALDKAVFEGKLRLRNFELWQAGLLGWLFEDLREGRVPLGSGKNKGWGQNNVTTTQVTLTYTGWSDPITDGGLRGVAELMAGTRRQHYGYVAEDDPSKLPQIGPEAVTSSGWRHMRVFAGEGATAFWNACRPSFNKTVWERFSALPSALPSSQAPDGADA